MRHCFSSFWLMRVERAVHEPGTGSFLNTCLRAAPALTRSMRDLLLVACGISVPDQGSNLGTPESGAQSQPLDPQGSLTGHRILEITSPRGAALSAGESLNMTHGVAVCMFLRASAEPDECCHP